MKERKYKSCPTFCTTEVKKDYFVEIKEGWLSKLVRWWLLHGPKGGKVMSDTMLTEFKLLLFPIIKM